ncbi:MAG: hypothetical protein NTU43_09005 [Bacteroidetes bacterium]|nr:hypothetical protein [Bacteroidota bacterium]
MYKPIIAAIFITYLGSGNTYMSQADKRTAIIITICIFVFIAVTSFGKRNK